MKFFEIMAENYEQYAFPVICGRIEALMNLEPKEWTQKELSERLTSIFPNPDSSTSISSVNRAIKILEDYGVVLKNGSRKIGYYYTLNTNSQTIVNMFQHMLVLNDNFINLLTNLMKNHDINNDKKLLEVAESQLQNARKFSNFFREVLENYK